MCGPRVKSTSFNWSKWENRLVTLSNLAAFYSLWKAKRNYERLLIVGSFLSSSYYHWLRQPHDEQTVWEPRGKMRLLLWLDRLGAMSAIGTVTLVHGAHLRELKYHYLVALFCLFYSTHTKSSLNYILTHSLWHFLGFYIGAYLINTPPLFPPSFFPLFPPSPLFPLLLSN